VVEAERRRRDGEGAGQDAGGSVVEFHLRAGGLDSRCVPDLVKAISFMLQAAGGDLVEVAFSDAGPDAEIAPPSHF
jgi:hypothetical protein